MICVPVKNQTPAISTLRLHTGEDVNYISLNVCHNLVITKGES